MKIKVLGDSKYENAGVTNYGDCIIVDNEKELLIYDCGSQEHAEEVIRYMNSNGYTDAKFVLSHNDDDHFKGLSYLLDQGVITEIQTVLLLKYKDKILKGIGDGRKNRDSLTDQILRIFDNISQLSGKGLKDVYEEAANGNDIIEGVSFAGPDLEYMINDVAVKALDTREGDTIDSESITNATSVQLKVAIASHTVLLTGDSSFAGMEEQLDGCDVVQLPHHGKVLQAEQIFENKALEPRTVYIVSDNTGTSNGGSDKLSDKAKDIRNTKKSGTIDITELNLPSANGRTGRILGC